MVDIDNYTISGHAIDRLKAKFNISRAESFSSHACG